MPAIRKTPRAESATEVLRRAIGESRLTFVELERQSGVKRQSLMKFARGEQSLRLDMADKLMRCLGLEIVRRRGRMVGAKEAAPGRPKIGRERVLPRGDTR